MFNPFRSPKTAPESAERPARSWSPGLRSTTGDGAAAPPLTGYRVALFTGAYNHIADGVSLTLNRLVRHLQMRGAEVLVFAPTVSDPPIDHAGVLDPVRSVAMPGRPEYRISLRLSSRQKERLAAFDPHLIHIATPDIPGNQARGLAHELGVPVVSSYHTHFSSYLSYYKLGWAEGMMWKRLRDFHSECLHTYVPSQSMADVLASHGISQGVRLWPRGVELDRFSPSHRDMAWRREQGFADTDIVVSLVSRLVLEKGLGVFAQTMELLRETELPIKCLVVGEGPAREELEERLPEAVFLGHQTGKDLSRAYASSDLFVFPSYTETFGNVTLEAMASGLPAVCADATGSRSLVKPGVTGFLAPPLEAEVFASHVERLVVDNELRERMSRASRDEARTYAWPAVLDRIVGYYLEILQPTTRSEPLESNVPVLEVAAD